MTEQELLTIAEERPENLLLVETGLLFSFVDDKYNAPDLRELALAELVARWCLSGNKELVSKFADIMGDVWMGDVWRRFSDWFNINRQWTSAHFRPEDFPGWKNPDEFPDFGRVLRRRLDRLFDANGFIPVCNSLGVWFIPFQLEESLEGAAWAGADGTEVTTWREPVSRALHGTDYRGIRLQLRQGGEVSVTGESLMLPVRMAALRGRPRRLPHYEPCGLPHYDVLRVLATGAFDEQFRLADVELRPKVDAAVKQFRDAVFFGPDVPGEMAASKCFHGLESGLGEQAVFQRIRDELERMPGCVKMNRDYALKRLPDMASHVDRENHHRWNEVAGQLEQIKKALFQWRDPGTWLEFCSLLATALCHAGRTEESRRCVCDAMSFARKNGYLAKALRLQVTAAVNAQDLGEIDEYRVLVSGLEEELSRFDGPEKDDLLMRYHGTVAQANAWGALYEMDGFTEAAAKEHAETAVSIAQKIANSATPDKKDEAESNLAQDLNYRHLVFAIFKPGTDEEKRAFDDARQQLNELSERSAKTNRYHQMRQRSLALLNAWRAGGAVPDKDTLGNYRLPLDAEGWLIATNRRHLGALAAAAGDTTEAERCFKEGDEALPLARCGAPVLASIRLALLVQAGCSLQDEDSTAATLYFQKAGDVGAMFGESKLFRSIKAERWISLVRPGTDARNLPQFYY